jgi:hypothetical protein
MWDCSGVVKPGSWAGGKRYPPVVTVVAVYRAIRGRTSSLEPPLRQVQIRVLQYVPLKSQLKVAVPILEGVVREGDFRYSATCIFAF